MKSSSLTRWSYPEVAGLTGRSLGYIHSAVQGLLPQHIVEALSRASRPPEGAVIRDELYQGLVDVISLGLATPTVKETLKSDPDAVMAAAEGLALLALLAGAERREPRTETGAAA